MAVFVLTHTDHIPHERDILVRAIEWGCKVHIRKPNWTWQATHTLAKGLEKQVVIHHEPNWAVDNSFLYHKKTTVAPHPKLQYVSTGIHHLEDMDKAKDYEYVFCSPMFTSISKPNYTGTIQPKQWIEKAKELDTLDQTVALGGIDDNQATELYTLGFKHIALMGCLWREPHRALEKLQHILSL